MYNSISEKFIVGFIMFGTFFMITLLACRFAYGDDRFQVAVESSFSRINLHIIFFYRIVILKDTTFVHAKNTIKALEQSFQENKSRFIYVGEYRFDIYLRFLRCLSKNGKDVSITICQEEMRGILRAPAKTGAYTSEEREYIKEIDSICNDFQVACLKKSDVYLKKKMRAL